jgi:hypothetical protein
MDTEGFRDRADEALAQGEEEVDGADRWPLRRAV